MPDATGLHHLRWRKKKVNGFIIPAKYFYERFREIDVKAPEIIEVPNPTIKVNAVADDGLSESSGPEPKAVVAITGETVVTPTNFPNANAAAIAPQSIITEPALPKVSALSLASIRAKKELQQANQSFVRKVEELPTEPFTEIQMLEQWNKYAQRLGDKGQKIMESLILINDPKLEGSKIIHELPNEGSKIDFESEKNELQGYLRGKLHNHDITIEVRVNESVENKFAFTAQDKYNRLNQINPTLDVLKKTFDLDI